MHGEVCWSGAEAGDEMILEGLDCAFGSIAAVSVWRYQLICNVVLGEEGLKKGWGFIIEDIMRGVYSPWCIMNGVT